MLFLLLIPKKVCFLLPMAPVHQGDLQIQQCTKCRGLCPHKGENSLYSSRLFKTILRGSRGYSSALKCGLKTKSPQLSSWSLEKHIHCGELSTEYCETRNKTMLGHSYLQLVWLRVFNDPLLGSHALLCCWRQSLDHSEEAAAGCYPVCDSCLLSVNSWFSRDWERLHHRHLSIDAYSLVDGNFANEHPWVSTGATVFMQCLELNLC